MVKRGIKKEIVIVDSGSADNTISIASKFTNADVQAIRVIRVGRCSISKARNVGWRNAKYDNILFLDSDIILNKKCFSKILKETGRYDVLIPGDVDSQIGLDRKSFQIPRDFMVVKRRVLERINGYSEAFPPWLASEDVDMLLRALKGGFRCGCVECDYVELGVGKRSGRKTLKYWAGGIFMNLKNIDTLVAKQWLVRKMLGITLFEYMKKTVKKYL
jgi:glycosyltransferase involved in cell wall biosynthesis